MPSVTPALEQMTRYVDFTDRYLRGYYDNLCLAARQGFTECPEWYLSDEAAQAYQTYGALLKVALDLLKVSTCNMAKHRVLEVMKQDAKRYRRQLDEEEGTPGFLALVSQEHAKWEVLDVFIEVLRGNTYVSHDYSKWNNRRTNRWYHTPYLHDEGALKGKVYWVNTQTRLVLFEEQLEIRWRYGRVLLSVAYKELDSITPFPYKRKEFWRLNLLNSSPYVLDVSWVENSAVLRAELVERAGRNLFPTQ